MELKKPAKIRKKKKKKKKNMKTQLLIRCLKSKKQFIFLKNLCQYLPHFEQKVAKNVFFFKNCEFWSQFDITNVFLVKLPF